MGGGYGQETGAVGFGHQIHPGMALHRQASATVAMDALLPPPATYAKTDEGGAPEIRRRPELARRHDHIHRLIHDRTPKSIILPNSGTGDMSGKGESGAVTEADFFLIFCKVFCLSYRHYYRRLGFLPAGDFGGCNISLDDQALPDPFVYGAEIGQFF